MFEFTFTADVVLWEGKAAWHFARLPADLSSEIDDLCGAMKGGWGSLKVKALIGTTHWETSIFPSGDGFVLPLKKQVRAAEGIGAGDAIEISLTI